MVFDILVKKKDRFKPDLLRKIRQILGRAAYCEYIIV